MRLNIWRVSPVVALALVLAGCDARSTGPSAADPRGASLEGAPTAPAAAQAVWDASLYVARLSWSHDGLNTTYYSVERAVYGSGEPFVEVMRVAAPASTAADTLPPDARFDRSYLYRIRACNAAGCSGPNEISVGVPRLEPPSVLTATATGASTVNLSWRDNSYNETAFGVTWQSSTGQTGVFGVPANSTSATFQAPVQGATYTFDVTALQYRPGQEQPVYSLSSNQASATPDGTTPPAGLVAPTNGVATYHPMENIISIGWSHDPSDGTTYYQVLRKRLEAPDVPSSWTAVATGPLSDRGAADIREAREAGFDQSYLYRIYACNSGGCSAPHEISIGVPRMEPPGALTATEGEGTVTLNWVDNSTYETGFVVLIQHPSGSYQQVRVPAGTTSVTVAGTPGTTYTYTVYAEVRNELNDQRAHSVQSNPITATPR